MINLQSDFMNLPNDEMWEAMRKTEPGFVAGKQDQTVNRLEALVAELLGKEEALFILTGRMACLIALMTYCERGNQVILEKDSHIAWCQEWGLSNICGLYPRLVKGNAGIMNLSDIESAITESRFGHTPKTDLVCLENSHNMAGGTVLTVEQTKNICEVAHKHGAKVYIDGCRLLYSAAALGVKPRDLAAPADGVSISLVKGICGHGGAILCGTSEDMKRAYLNLKRIGAASFHRAGMLAASGIVAIETMMGRLREDIVRAKDFAKALAGMNGIRINLDTVQTNIVIADISHSGLNSDDLLNNLQKLGIKAAKYTEKNVRFTFHRNISDDDAKRTIFAIRRIIENKGI